ncbi:putative T4-like DNA polymerase [Ralstonia phage RP31]|uniref:Putative T4-like DNA polymerase n=2 Tax=Ripduovirus RP12 TaxID=2560700 RepID=A0A1L7N175_9CAUD|nr:DNA polymerase [Ralstonia phage RP12]BAW19225.1 putative T4-like DNA polymerase [Ralstonia phage RP12]BAW19511.1 putative T4-like DNA polymerase [Ralstonia phage RP31]
MSTKKPNFSPEDISGVECRHVVFIPPIKDSKDDYHLIKEVIHLKDGQRVPNVRIVRNYKRKFWITKEGYRRHKQKKEWEDISKLKEYECTQSELVEKAAKALGMFKPPRSLKQLSRSPYLYGSDILSTSVIKQEVYRNRWPELNTPSSSAASDTETDMVQGHGRIIMQTISMKEKVYTAVVRDFLRGVGGTDADKIKLCQEALIKYLDIDEPVLKKDGTPEIDKKTGKPKVTNVYRDRKLEWEIELVENDGMVVYNTLKKAHEWQPDFMTFWNMDFDIKKMEESLKFHKIPLADAWSDPAVAPAYRFYEYKEGQSQKVTASGKVTPIAPHARWHTVITPASFYVMDAMCAYKQVRTGKQEERAYTLEFILNKHLKRGKLKFTAADGLAKADWHVFMQKKHPIEYIVYNVFDCVGLEMLDEKTKDLSVSVPSGAAMSDYSRFNSQPRRVVDKLHYFVQARGKIIGTTSDEMATDFDQETISLKNWIVMLPAHLVADNGLKIIKEYPDICSNLRLHIGDLDVSASYPNGESVFNISKETTKKELISIEGVSENVRRMQGINLSAGATNAVEFCTGMFHMPQMTQWLEAYRRQDDLVQVAMDLRDWVDDSAATADAVISMREDEDENEYA